MATISNQNEQQQCLIQTSETATTEEAEENAALLKPPDHRIQITTTITNVAVQSNNGMSNRLF
jgi:hypothetical protein